MIEGIGRTVSDNKPVVQAIGIISYDDETETYHLRAFNDGRFLESAVKLTDDGKGLTWGFSFGQIRSNSVLKFDEKGSKRNGRKSLLAPNPRRELMDLTVRRDSQ